jgi:ribonuclease Z
VAGLGVPLTLIGRSWAADCTAFFIPELSWQLDAGSIVTPSHPRYVFVTHTHTDHSHMLTHLKSRRKPSHIFSPHVSVDLIDNYLTAAQLMTAVNRHKSIANFEWQRSYWLHGVAGKSTCDLPAASQMNDKTTLTVSVVSDADSKQAAAPATTKTQIHKGFRVRVIDCDHSVECVGYMFSLVKSKLREDLAGLPGREIGAMRKRGENVSREVEVPAFVFLGDTTHAVFDQNPEILKHPIVIVECTFLEDDDVKHAERTKHMHWMHLRKYVENNPETKFVLIHFSRRYNSAQVLDFFHQEQADGKYKNIVVWAHHQQTGPAAANDTSVNVNANANANVNACPHHHHRDTASDSDDSSA